MKLLTLEEAKNYKLDDTNHIENKEQPVIDDPCVGVSYDVVDWNTNTKNEKGEELVILLDDEGYWQPYVEWLFKLQNIPAGEKYVFGYIDGTMHKKGPLTNNFTGMSSSGNFEGYRIWARYKRD